jgi:hypothetical protein
MTYFQQRQSWAQGMPKPEVVKKVHQLKKCPLKKKTVSQKVRPEMPIPELLQLAQMVFNKWIRERDKTLPCISGGGKSEEAGHYYSVKQFSGVRFDEINVNGQSIADNRHEHGNAAGYAKGLIDRYGIDAYEELRRRANLTRLKKWSREELEQIIKKYKI